jgi:hypothetical protein
MRPQPRQCLLLPGRALGGARRRRPPRRARASGDRRGGLGIGLAPARLFERRPPKWLRSSSALQNAPCGSGGGSPQEPQGLHNHEKLTSLSHLHLERVRRPPRRRARRREAGRRIEARRGPPGAQAPRRQNWSRVTRVHAPRQTGRDSPGAADPDARRGAPRRAQVLRRCERAARGAEPPRGVRRPADELDELRKREAGARVGLQAAKEPGERAVAEGLLRGLAIPPHLAVMVYRTWLSGRRQNVTQSHTRARPRPAPAAGTARRPAGRARRGRARRRA